MRSDNSNGEAVEAYVETDSDGSEMFVLHSELSPFGWMAVDETMEVRR